MKGLSMQIVLNMPDFVSLTLNESASELKQTIKLNTALMLFKKGKFSIEQASNFSSLSIYEFLKECRENEISVIDYSEEELLQELSLMSDL